jgi:peroxiredoxin
VRGVKAVQAVPLTSIRASVRPGEYAPDFTLPSVMEERSIALADYRNESAVLVGLFRGLHCPFCRRQIFLLSGIEETLRRANIVTLAVLNTERNRAALYFRHNPTHVTLLADRDASTHGLFGVPSVIADERFRALRVNPTGELVTPIHPIEANAVLNAKDNFTMTAVDEAVFAEHAAQLVGHFLIDRAGVVRWSSVECEQGLQTLATFPSTTEILAAARRL